MNSITIGLNLPNEGKGRTVQKKNLSKLSDCLFYNLLHLLASVIKFRLRHFSVKRMSEKKKRRKKPALNFQM